MPEADEGGHAVEALKVAGHAPECGEGKAAAAIVELEGCF